MLFFSLQQLHAISLLVFKYICFINRSKFPSATSCKFKSCYRQCVQFLHAYKQVNPLHNHSVFLLGSPKYRPPVNSRTIIISTSFAISFLRGEASSKAWNSFYRPKIGKQVKMLTNSKQSFFRA